ncbi:hypothetical protein [Sphingobium sp. EM0848]|uniref:hypothetical protein n=1 Tax=Sphingobium sp. EM0848 TaxID=2743473 RepID=UPI00159CA6D9|nr:hypothetical protein [Sphingobium sp. EM0848]
MKLWHLRIVIAASAAFVPALSLDAAQAGLYQDDLSRCLVAAARPEDRTVFVRWVFAAMATNPKIQDMARVSAEQSKDLTGNAARLMQRLLLEDCRKQTVDALKYENGGAIEQAFSTLGQIAMSDLMRDEGTSAYMAGLSEHLDEKRWRDLASEAGVKAPPKTP